MDTGSMKNIVVLKDLPSNLVEEAIIFLKENHKLKRPELIDIDTQKKGEVVKKQKLVDNQKNYIVNEAQMLIADYISKIENKNRKEDISYKRLKKKYKSLKKVTVFLTIALITSIIVAFTI